MSTTYYITTHRLSSPPRCTRRAAPHPHASHASHAPRPPPPARPRPPPPPTSLPSRLPFPPPAQVCKTAPVPGETKVWQYIPLMKRIFLIDCPGVVYNKTSDSESDAVLKGVVRVENLADAAEHVKEVLARVKPEYLVGGWGRRAGGWGVACGLGAGWGCLPAAGCGPAGWAGGWPRALVACALRATSPRAARRACPRRARRPGGCGRAARARSGACTPAACPAATCTPAPLHPCTLQGPARAVMIHSFLVDMDTELN
jgi:hypothetical protein